MPRCYSYNKKVKKLIELLDITKDLKHTNSKIVFTNGCFDILHKGHVTYLRESRRLGDYLIVGLNSDASVKKLKGEGRPVNTENDRAFLLEALDFVDFIIIFDETTPLKILNELEPDIYTKGGDYDMSNVVGPGLGKDIIEKYGGKVELISMTPGYSSSKIIDGVL